MIVAAMATLLLSSQTIGVLFKISTSSHDMEFDLCMWDTAGHERFRSLTATYLRGANIAVGVFSSSDENSLEVARSLLIQACNSVPSCTLVLVETKIDISGMDRDCQALVRLMDELGIPQENFVRVSAKTGDGISELRDLLTEISYRQYIDAAMLSTRPTVNDPCGNDNGAIGGNKSSCLIC